jgi:hypothetical protein
VRRLVLLLASLAALAGESRAQVDEADALLLDGYVAELDAVRAHLESGRLEEARAAASALRGRAVAWGDEALVADASVLGAVLAARDAADGRRAAARLRRLLVALGAPPGSDVPTPAQADLLARLAPPDDLRKGGDVPRLRVKPLTFPERVEAALVSAADAIASVLRRLADWLRAIRPRRVDPAPTPGRTAVAAITVALGVVAVLAVLVLRARRRRAAPAPEAGTPRAVASRRDEDPLSREASGWEERARELAAERRFREAIRAWYHAVLVALFQAGLLHHQKGRTNWEYAARLDPGLGWRPGFITLTRLFDREWYGRRASDAATLAECAREARGVLVAVRDTEGTA